LAPTVHDPEYRSAVSLCTPKRRIPVPLDGGVGPTFAFSTGTIAFGLSLGRVSNTRFGVALR
jgi:hypothetical protein